MKVSSKFNLLHFVKNLTLTEIAGSIGDLGTLLPIMIALTKNNSISLTYSLIFGGLYNIYTGFYYDIPVCVQPLRLVNLSFEKMKSIAAIAIANNFSMPEVAASGILVSAIVLILGITQTITFVYKYIPLPIIRGIQLGTGLRLITQGVTVITSSNKWIFSNFYWSDNYLIAIISALICFLFYNAKKNFSALILFLFGLTVGLVKIYLIKDVKDKNLTIPSVGLSPPVCQLPLTILNSVIAISKLADDLFPFKRRPVVSLTSISVSIGIMNLIGCWFGAMPYCHGSGGLAGQFRFGARTGSSIIFLGIVKLFCGFLFGNTLLGLLMKFPNSVLGVMLIFAGLELCSVAKDVGSEYLSYKENDFEELDEESKKKKNEKYQQSNNNYVIMLSTAGTLVGFSNDGIGFLVGCTASIIFFYEKKFSTANINKNDSTNVSDN
ncbi:hypothetical protein HK099_007107 [Clydaea vesicula]|uniref:Sulfate transporter n=1 Tax=Clydaea vesicula TaxID=447962 RepID=A0AAD5U0E3_9FUNG|nr:hypothetical protein HK099_007107 [Clydaea vesicula]